MQLNFNDAKEHISKAVLVGIVTRDTNACEVEKELDELARLLDTAGGEEVARLVQNKETPDPRTMIGSGKAAEREADGGNGGSGKLQLVIVEQIQADAVGAVRGVAVFGIHVGLLVALKLLPLVLLGAVAFLGVGGGVLQEPGLEILVVHVLGPQGFGGRTTALAVNIEEYPTHIAGLPVAVNINCHVTRHKTEVL